jgi:glycosyltransferase involved in cell wall biosynthesis
MACGGAVIASQDGAIQEVAGDAAILVDINDRPGWIQALTLLIGDSDHNCALRRKALARAANFSWAKTARLTREVYGQSIERFRKKT